MEKKYIILILIVIAVIVSGYIYYKQTHKTKRGKEGANALIQAYTHNENELDSNNDISFGEYGFNYYPNKDILTGRVFVTKGRIKTASEEGKKNIRMIVQALHDPKIGGMFDQGGGYFIFDEEKEMLFLAKDFSVSTTSVATFNSEMDNLRDLAGIWTTRWFYRFTRMVQGHEPVPTTFIAREHDLP